MSYEAAQFWLDVAQFAVLGAIGIYVHVVTRQRVTETQFDELRKDLHLSLDGFGQRLARAEEAQRHGPTHGDMSSLARELGELRGDVQQMAGGLEGIRRAVDLINQHLLNRP